MRCVNLITITVTSVCCVDALRFAHEEPAQDEEVIRCVCGIYKDEGKMIMCDRCEVWQHCDCMSVSDDIDKYLCEECDPRPVNKVQINS